MIKEYAEWLKAGHKFPPLLVAFDGSSYWLVDGFHRRWAAVKCKLDKFQCEVVQGTIEDARWMSYAANKVHGLPRTNADKEKAVTSALSHPKAERLSTCQIAEHCGVNEKTVRNYRKSVTSEFPKSDDRPRTGRDGRTINTANIGKSKQEAMPPQCRLTAKTESEPVSRPVMNDDPPLKEKPRHEQGGEVGVFCRLRELFNDMTVSERKQAAIMWEDWLGD